MSDGSTPVIVFIPPSSQGYDIVWTALSNIQPPNVGYNFTPTNNDWVANHYTNVGSSYVYSYTPPPPPTNVPNIQGFIAAVMADPTINSTAQIGLAAWYPQLAMFINQPTVLDQGWQALCNAYSGSWLTPTVQNAVETYAVQYNIPLVP
jgi:hypothetical protein